MSWSLGSSPRARGADPQESPFRHFPGIIPARAGSRSRLNKLRLAHQDHPRARGEQANGLWLRSGAGGSSPRARGAERISLFAESSQGIIPARAGSSVAVAHACSTLEDHPRARGEQLGRPMTYSDRKGSSPRARGAAGTSRSIENLDMDHPRARGEQVSIVCASLALLGSSPRARGAVTRTCGVLRMSRIIPARAGSRTR